MSERGASTLGSYYALFNSVIVFNDNNLGARKVIRYVQMTTGVDEAST